MNTPEQFPVEQEDEGKRLDKFLVARFSHLTRSKIQKIIKDGNVVVNGVIASVHRFLKRGDMVHVKEQATAPAVPNEKVQQAVAKGYEVVAETDDYVVIKKPAGLLVHAAPGHEETTLVDLLLKKYPSLANVGDDPTRPGIVHRLDRDVSGLLVVAKTQVIFDHLKQQFQGRTIKKEYTCLVYGGPAKDEGDIEFRIARSSRGFKMAALPRQGRGEPDDVGREAKTHFEVLERYYHYTLLKVVPETGRSHQIRVHLHAYGIPILGDQMYKPRKLKERIRLNRIFLESTAIGFSDLAGQIQEYRIPLSKELQDILTALKKPKPVLTK